MARYKLLAAAVIDDVLHAAGEEIEFDGIPGRHMEPLDRAAKAAVKDMPGPAPLDPDDLAYRHDRSIPGEAGVYTGFYGFSSGSTPGNVDVPHVSGGVTVGNTLTCTMGNWTGEPTEYSYAWQSDGEPNGAVGSTYDIVAGDAGHTITCVVTATNVWGSTTAPPSNGIDVSAAARKTGGSRG